MKIIKKVAGWLEAAGRLWAAYWLLIIGCLLVCGSVFLRWINFPISQSFSGAQVPLIRTIGLAPQYHVLSYGAFAIAVLAVGLLSRSFSNRPLLLAAAVLITIFVSVPCQMAFEHPTILHRLDDEVYYVSLARSFTKNYLPHNFGYIEDIPSHLELGTAWGRFLASISFLGLGWFCFGIGSLLIALYAIVWLQEKTRFLILACLFLPIAALAILLTRPLLGQYYFVRARIAQAQGQNQKAIVNYRKAINWDQWFADDVTSYAMIGDLQRQSNFAEGSPERHIRQAQILREAGQFEPAIFEYTQAASAGGSVALAARREAAETRLEFGLALYRAGAVGGAVTNWQRSLADNPAQLVGLVFLARGDYDLARYQAALDAANEVINAAGLNSIEANAYSLGGDCYTRLGRNADARRYYTKSIKLDNDINLWATAALAGD